MATLCSLDDVREALGRDDADTSRDALLVRLVDAATAAIHGYTQRELCDVGAAVRRFEVSGSGAWRVATLAGCDLRSATSVTLHPEDAAPVALAADAGYQLRPVNRTSIGTYRLVKIAGDAAIFSAYATRFGRALVEIDGQWGPAATPEDVRQIAISTVVSWYRREFAHRTTAFDPDADATEQLADATSLPAGARRGLSVYRSRPVA